MRYNGTEHKLFNKNIRKIETAYLLMHELYNIVNAPLYAHLQACYGIANEIFHSLLLYASEVAPCKLLPSEVN